MVVADFLDTDRPSNFIVRPMFPRPLRYDPKPVSFARVFTIPSATARTNTGPAPGVHA